MSPTAEPDPERTEPPATRDESGETPQGTDEASARPFQANARLIRSRLDDERKKARRRRWWKLGL